MKTDASTNLVGLARGHGRPRWLNASERGLLRFALDRFGEPLAAFLLTGLGGDVTARRRRFTVAFDDRQGARYERRITVTAEPRARGLRPRLPRGKEPLAMLAFLHLLVEGRKLSSFAMRYEPAEVLQVLGWETPRRLRASWTAPRRATSASTTGGNSAGMSWRPGISLPTGARHVSSPAVPCIRQRRQGRSGGC